MGVWVMVLAGAVSMPLSIINITSPCSAFVSDKVRFRRPAPSRIAPSADSWFSLMLIHQNRDNR